MTRARRKVKQIRDWLNSVWGPADWPVALALAIFRTRPLSGDGVFDRVARRLLPHVWIRPRVLGGYALRINPADMNHFVIYEEVFIGRSYDLDHLNFRPDAVIDCGAFEGYFSLQAMARFKSATLVAFEPNVENYAGLMANAERNGLTIDARREAVSTRDGRELFRGAGCGGRLIHGSAHAPAERVTVTDLRRIITQLAPQRLLIKLDVEGEEDTLLPAIIPILPRECALFFEWHHGESGFQDAQQLLKDVGFVVERTRTRVPCHDGMEFVDAFAHRS
jgi:FkbM family methyltransferase